MGLHHLKRKPKKIIGEGQVRTNPSDLVASPATEPLRCEERGSQEEGRLLCSLEQLPISLFSLPFLHHFQEFPFQQGWREGLALGTGAGVAQVADVWSHILHDGCTIPFNTCTPLYTS